MGVLVELVKCAEGGYAAFVLSLPKCAAQGKTKEEVLKNVEGVITAMVKSFGGFNKTPWKSNYQRRPDREYEVIEFYGP